VPHVQGRVAPASSKIAACCCLDQHSPHNITAICLVAFINMTQALALCMPFLTPTASLSRIFIYQNSFMAKNVWKGIAYHLGGQHNSAMPL